MGPQYNSSTALWIVSWLDIVTRVLRIAVKDPPVCSMGKLGDSKIRKDQLICPVVKENEIRIGWENN